MKGHKNPNKQRRNNYTKRNTNKLNRKVFILANRSVKKVIKARFVGTKNAEKVLKSFADKKKKGHLLATLLRNLAFQNRLRRKGHEKKIYLTVLQFLKRRPFQRWQRFNQWRFLTKQSFNIQR